MDTVACSEATARFHECVAVSVPVSRDGKRNLDAVSVSPTDVQATLFRACMVPDVLSSGRSEWPFFGRWCVMGPNVQTNVSYRVDVSKFKPQEGQDKLGGSAGIGVMLTCLSRRVPCRSAALVWYGVVRTECAHSAMGKRQCQLISRVLCLLWAAFTN